MKETLNILCIACIIVIVGLALVECLALITCPLLVIDVTQCFYADHPESNIM